VFENRVLRRIFGPKRDGVTGGWRKLHNEELHYLYFSPSIITIIKSRRMRWAGHVTRMGEKRNVYRLLVGKPSGKRPLRRPRRRWVDNIKLGLAETGCGGEDWFGVAQDRGSWGVLVIAVMNLRVTAAVLWKYTECWSGLCVIMILSEIKPCVNTQQDECISKEWRRFEMMWFLSERASCCNLSPQAITFIPRSVLTRATRCHIPEDGVLHSHRRENLKSDIALTGWAL
jgi:hypothetical protein